MEKITVLGTGFAVAEKLFNTCFVLESANGEKILVDTGGGNQILSKLTDNNINLEDIHDIFISHKHTDHVLGILWLIRKVEGYIKKGKYEGNLNIYCHKELKKVILGLCELTLKKRFLEIIGERIFIKVVEDRQEETIIGCKFKFLDIYAKSDLQYGFKVYLSDDKTLVFLGDEPYDEKNRDEVQNATYLCHESFCVDSENDKYTPYKFNHGTAKTAAIKAEELNVKNLILWHTREDDLDIRQKKHYDEAKEYFKGNVIVPNDNDVIELK